MHQIADFSGVPILHAQPETSIPVSGQIQLVKAGRAVSQNSLPLFHQFDSIRKLLKGEMPELTAGEQLWDYIHINDLVEAMYCIAYKGRDGAFYSIGHGDNWPLYKYIEIIHKQIDSSLPIGIGEIPYEDERIPSSCMDLSTLESDTGFSPKIPFETGIQEVIEKIKQEIHQN